MRTYEQLVAKAIRELHHVEVIGESRCGNTTKRDGRRVSCRHRHRGFGSIGLRRCLARMRRDRPGNCQQYMPREIVTLVLPKTSR